MQHFCIYTWPSQDVCWLCSTLIQSNAEHGLFSTAWHPCSGSMADKWRVWRTGDVKLLFLYVLEVCQTSDLFGSVVMSNYWFCMFWKCVRQVTHLERWWCQTAESHWALLSGTFLQTLPDLVTPLKGYSLSPCSCPLTWSAPSERFGYQYDWRSNLAPNQACKHETHPPWVKKKKNKKFCLDSDNFGFIWAAISNMVRYKTSIWYNLSFL